MGKGYTSLPFDFIDYSGIYERIMCAKNHIAGCTLLHEDKNKQFWKYNACERTFWTHKSSYLRSHSRR